MRGDDANAHGGTGADGRGTYGRVPARVLLRGEADGWHYAVVDQSGVEEHVGLGGSGTRWQTGMRRDPEPPWWQRKLGEDAEALRRHVGMVLTDRCFRLFGGEAEITWFAVEEPVSWEGIVTLGDPDPARFPGRVPPYVVTLEPGRGVLLPGANLLFDMVAADAWTVLAGVAEACGSPPPKAQFLCGWSDHRNVRVGRGFLAVSTGRGPDGVERVGEIFGQRWEGWGGNPDLRLRLDGIDLLHDAAEDVVWLLQEIGHEVVEHGCTRRLPAIGLTLHMKNGKNASLQEAFEAVSLQAPGSFGSPER